MQHNKMTDNIPLTSSRLTLCRWQLSDSANLYELAKNPNVALITGWNPHQNEEESLYVIEHILCKPHIFAICLADNTIIGSIGLHFQGNSNCPLEENEAELGYWLGELFWGKGYATEASKIMIKYAFEQLGLQRLKAVVYEENRASKHVLEKCNFAFQHSLENQIAPLTGLIHNHLFYVLEKN